MSKGKGQIGLTSLLLNLLYDGIFALQHPAGAGFDIIIGKRAPGVKQDH
jgi:hypothetical protein